MPWNVGQKTSKGWPIVKSSTGQIVGYSQTKGRAQASIRARYANTSEGLSKQKRFDGRSYAMRRLGLKKNSLDAK